MMILWLFMHIALAAVDKTTSTLFYFNTRYQNRFGIWHFTEFLCQCNSDDYVEQ